MAKLFDRVKVNIATTGTGDITFGAASSNAFLTPAEAGATDGDVARYVIVDGTDFEEGVGTIGDTVATMTRTVTRSKIAGSVGTSKIDLSGTAVLAFIASASDILNPAALSAVITTLLASANEDEALDSLGAGATGKDLLAAATPEDAKTVLAIQAGASDTERQNLLLSLIYQAKVFGVFRRLVNLFATGWKGSTDSDYGINTGASSNYAVTPGSAGAITGYVAPTSIPGTSQVPTMTSNTTPSGVASASPSLSGGTAYQAFDNNGSTAIYWNVGNLPGILQYQFTAGKVITSYTLRLNTATDTVAIGGWKSWTFEGSNDGSSWDTLDTRSGVTLSADTDNSFSFSNSTSYTYYRWRVTTGGSTRASLNIATMLDPPTTNNMTVVTASQTADASVSNARVLIEFDNSASPTLNTDLIAEVTCDGGSNWASATLSSVTADGQDGRSVAETADTSCAAGTSFAARLNTANGKAVKIYGASVVAH